MLELECTETMVIRNFALFRELMAALPSRGSAVRWTISARGYSSLNMLKRSRSTCSSWTSPFFRDTEGTPRERAVVESIVQMARALGMSTVAEGVEKQGAGGVSPLDRVQRDSGATFFPTRPARSL